MSKTSVLAFGKFTNSAASRGLFASLVVMIGAVVLTGCASAPQSETTPQDKAEELVWPAPPSQPVIKHLRTFRSSSDVSRKESQNWKDSLLGFEDERAWVTKSPYGVGIDAQGRILVADVVYPGLAVFDFEQRKFSIIGAAQQGQIQQPINAAADRFGRIYVADGSGQKVSIFDQNGNFLNNLGADEGFERPVDIAIDDQRERIYVSDSLRHHIVVFDFEGNRVTKIGQRGIDLPGYYNFPLNMALDSHGHLYVVDSMNFRIQVFDPDSGEFRTIGQQGQNPGQFVRPKGIAIDSDDNVYVSDAAFNNIQMFNRNGQLLMAFGQRGRAPGQFLLPANLTIDAQNRIYVADQMNKRIQVFKYLGKPDLGEEVENTSDQ